MVGIARLVALAATAFLVSLPLAAQQPGRPAPEPLRTVLELTEAARREVPQDELIAAMVARAEAADAAAAQNTVNRMMTAALETARRVSGVRATSGGYTVIQMTREGEPPVWVAEQQLNLVSNNGPALLGLVGELQGAGLAIQDLRWTLAANTRRGIERQLLGEAMDALARTARTAADALDMRLIGWQRVTLLPNGPVERFHSPMMAMEARADMAPPVAAPGTSEVVVTVNAEAILGSGR